MNQVELVGAALGFLFTLLVFSYLLGDNPLFRVAISLFVGVSAGFAGAVALRNVIFPNLVLPLLHWFLVGTANQDLLALVPLLLSGLLLTKLSRRMGRLGNVAMAYLVGVGAAAAIGGSLLGTLFPQVTASMNLLDLSTLGLDRSAALEYGLEALSRFFALFGTLATLIYFHFGARTVPDAPPERARWIEGIGKIGQGFIAVTFGVMFAGVYTAAITALIERLYALFVFVAQLFTLF